MGVPLMKVQSNNLLSQLAKKHLKPATKEESAPAKDGFASRPHADFDTNLEKLRSASLRESPEAKKPDHYSEPLTNQDVDQAGFQERLIADLGAGFARMQYTHDCSKLQGMIPTQSQLQAEFDKLAGDKNIPFEYIVDGCYARAHKMCEQMHDDNINTSKMFVMVENPYGGGRLTAENKYMEAKWWYHVAPMVWAVDDKSKQVVPFIMDPSMAPKPMKAEEWIHAMWDENTKIKVDVVRDPQYGPLESGGANATFEESIPSSNEVCAEYTKELEKIKEQYEQDHPSDPPAPPQQKAA